MLTEQDFNIIQAFATDNDPEAHIYGYSIVHKPDGSNLGTSPINSSDKDATNYFISNNKTTGNTITGYPVTQISKVELHKGNATLIVADKAIHIHLNATGNESI